MRGKGAATNLRLKNTGKQVVTVISGSDFAVRPLSGPENVAEICAPSPDTNLCFANLRFGNPRLFNDLSGIVLCDAAATRIRIRLVRCQRPATCQKHEPLVWRVCRTELDERSFEARKFLTKNALKFPRSF